MIRAKVKFEEKGKGAWEKFRKQMSKIKGSYVTVGVHEGAGQYDNGVSVVEVALWQEFGTERIPERSWLRSTLDAHIHDINEWREHLLEQILDGKITAEQALETIGFRLRELLKNKINSNIPPPNAPSTIAHKKREGVAPRTLVETTLLLRSIEYKVVMK